MRVAILVAGLPPDRIGGAELQAARMAEHLAARHDVTVLTRTVRVPSELAGMARCQVVQRCGQQRRGVRFVADIVSTLRHLFARRRDLDVILAYQTVIDGLIGVLARRVLGIPVVVFVRSDEDYQLDRYRQSRLLSPFVFRHADRILVQSPTIAANLLAVFAHRPGEPSADRLRERIAVVPNGVGPRGAPSPDGQLILFVGRLSTVKGVGFLIEAMKTCQGESLLIVGDGPERERLEAQAAGLGNVTFAGMASPAGVERYMAQAKMLVLPSVQEGQPNVVLEAMAMGIPVIASRVGGVPDLVRDGETGFLVTPGDVAGIAARIREIAGDAALRTRLSDASRHHMQQHEWPHVTERMERELSIACAPRAVSA